MGVFDTFFEALPPLLPLLLALATTAAVLLGANWVLIVRRPHLRGESRVSSQLIMLALTLACVVLIVLVLPVGETTRGQLLTLLGVAATATIALSSTTFASNAMAGLMIRAVRSFRPGDFVRVGDDFGRVTERGLFHTEIQTEDRDLTTLPNLYLVSHPITVVRSSGTIVSSRVSLGYDIPRARLEPLLVEAAAQADLKEPFVQVTDLGDYSVTYRIAGFLPEVKQLLTARSTLRKRIMDTLHEVGIEIVSPMYMNQRTVRSAVVPEGAVSQRRQVGHEAPESLIFDKAEVAQALEDLRKERELIAAEMKDLKARIEQADEPLRTRLETDLESRRRRTEAIVQQLRAAAEVEPDE